MARTDAKANAVLVCGSDEFKASEAARELVNSFCPPANQAFGLEVIDGDREKVDDVAAVLRQCLGALQTVGFFSEAKTVWLKDATFLGDLGVLKSEVVKPLLDELLAECRKGLLPGQKLVISSRSTDKRAAFFKSWQEAGEIRAFDVPFKAQEMEEDAREFAAGLFDKEGIRIDSDALESLIRKCADNRALSMEVEKLILYVSGRKRVARADVESITSSTRETMGWDLADAFGRRDLASALRVLRQLLFQKESPHGLIAGLESRIRELLIIRDCLQRRWARLSGSGNWQKLAWETPPEGEPLFEAFEKDPRKMNEWRAGKIAQQAMAFSLADLQRCHRLVVEIHERMVSSPVPPETLLELFLVKSLAKGAHARV